MKNLTPQLLHTVTKQLLNGRANVTLGAWKESLQRHPQHPSMQSLADTLQRWGFDNAALRLVSEQLAELPYPYIAHFREQGGKFVGVLDRKEDRLYTTDGLTEDWIELGGFEKSWSGVVLLVEPKEKNGDPDYSHKRKVEVLQSLRLPTLIGAFTVLILSALVLTPSFSLLAALYVVLSMAGLGLSIALVSLNLEGKNSPAQKLCQTSDNTDCHSVLDSPAAKLLGIFSWAELGMLYFGFALVFLLTGMISQQVASTLNLLAAISFLALLYVPYSLYYQARVIRQWCRFCLSVQAILLLQAVAGIAFGSFSYQTLLLFPYTPFLWGLAIPMIVWLVVKPSWVDSVKGKKASQNLRRFQSNEKLFAEMHAIQVAMPPIPENMPVFRYGNPDAANTLTVITNPFCGPCSQMHERIDEILAANLLLRVETIVLTGNESNDKRTQIAACWLSLNENGQNVQEAMEKWHKLGVKDVESYTREMTCAIDQSQMERVMASFQWANEAEVNSTPTMLLNGKRIPEPFQVEDLEYLLVNELVREAN